MKRRIYFLPILAIVAFFLFPLCAEGNALGIVNFTTCITDSKYGQQEQEAFDDVRNKITSIMTDLEGQLTEIANKLQDPEFIDSLSPEAEQEMKSRFQALNEELGRYQNQYYQVMNQANMKLIQLMTSYISQASATVAKAHKLSVILNKEACFFYEPKQDVTAAIIAEMDKNFDKEANLQKAAVPSEQAPH